MKASFQPLESIQLSHPLQLAGRGHPFLIHGDKVKLAVSFQLRLVSALVEDAQVFIPLENVAAMRASEKTIEEWLGTEPAPEAPPAEKKPWRK